MSFRMGNFLKQNLDSQLYPESEFDSENIFRGEKFWTLHVRKIPICDLEWLNKQPFKPHPWCATRFYTRTVTFSHYGGLNA